MHMLSQERRVEQSRNCKSRRFHRTTTKNPHLTASLQEEQIQLQKMLNPWSQVIGGQSQRYFKQRQHMQCQKRNSDVMLQL